MKNSSFVAIGGIAVAVVAAAVIGSRLSEQTLALMTGALLGGVVALPLGMLIGWVARPARSVDRTETHHPPTVVVTPQTYAGTPSGSMWQTPYPNASNAPLNAPRQFTIGGEEIVSHESDAVW